MPIVTLRKIKNQRDKDRAAPQRVVQPRSAMISTGQRATPRSASRSAAKIKNGVVSDAPAAEDPEVGGSRPARFVWGRRLSAINDETAL